MFFSFSWSKNLLALDVDLSIKDHGLPNKSVAGSGKTPHSNIQRVPNQNQDIFIDSAELSPLSVLENGKKDIYGSAKHIIFFSYSSLGNLVFNRPLILIKKFYGGDSAEDQ